MGIKLSKDLRAEYSRLWSSAELRVERLAPARKEVDTIRANAVRYQEVAATLLPGPPPWELIGVIHALESDCNFETHLHNGDPLSSWTTHVPKGRPESGTPPFKWEFSAEDALRLARWDRLTDWSTPGMLYVLERWNGWGYRRYHPATPSPYLWAGTTVYRSGLYVADGTFDPLAVSKQVGGAALLRLLGVGDA